MVRRVVADLGLRWDSPGPNGVETLGATLLTPTEIYVKPCLALLKMGGVHAIGHITGGGFWENIPRVLPASAQAVIDGNSWQWPEIFTWLQEQGNVTEHEMYRTFNCGVGLMIALPQDQVASALQILQDAGEAAWVIGCIAEKSGSESVVMA